ncbi:MAG: hypothetical protein ABI591_25505 [Kofleriaceae bacterium]
MTGLSVGTGASHICGAFDQLHFTSTTQSADDDRYRITVTVATPLLVDVFVGNGVEILSGVTVRFFDTSTLPVLLAEAKPAMTDHGAFIVTLPAGDYDMVVVGDANGELQGDSIPYRVRISPMPACDATTGAASYTETNDVGGANDTVAVDFTKDPSFTAMASTAPEVTSLSIDPGASVSITGALDTQARTDQYLDRDTYEITTGEDSNELAVRLDWDGAASDLDYLVFEASTMLPVVASNVSSNTGPELQMFAVKPSTKYWLWIGGFEGSMAATYRATVCGNRWFY